MSRRYVLPNQTGVSMQGMAPPVQAVPVVPTNATPQPGVMPNYANQFNPTLQQPQLTVPWTNDKLLQGAALPDGRQFPAYFRTTTTVIPASKEVMDNAGIPIGILVNSASVTDVPVLNYSQSSVPRCSKCAAYLSPYTTAFPDGKTYTCPMCQTKNVLPSNDLVNQIPLQQRPELSNLVYDMKAPRPYISMPYVTSAFCFIVDTSAPALQSGFTQQFLTSVKASIANLPENTRIAIMTMSHIITVFDFRRSTEFIVGDLSDMDLQFPYVPTIAECREQINLAIDLLISKEPEYDSNCYGSALEAAERLMTAIGGVIIAGVYGRPQYGPRLVPPREITPQTQESDLIHLPKGDTCKFWREIAFRINRAACSVNLFCCSADNKADIAVIGVPCGLTGGICKYYGQFDEVAAVKLHNDLFDVITQEYNYNCTLRLRCSEGIKLLRPQGTFSIQHKDLISFPILNPHNATGFELSVEQPLNYKNAYFQLAMLWTTKEMTRMIRVFTFSLPVSTDVNAVKQHIDEGAILCYLTKRAVLDNLTVGPLNALSNFKKEVSKLITRSVPFESFQYLSHALAVSPLLSSRPPNGVDGRMATIITCRQSSIVNLCLMIYPRFFAIDTNAGPLALTSASFAQGGVFLVHMIDKIIIWVSEGATQEYLMNVFGCTSIRDLPDQLPQLETPEAQRLQELINESMNISARYLPVEIIPQGDSREVIFSDILIDDDSQTRASLAKWMSEVRNFH